MYIKVLIQNAEELSVLVNNVFLTLLDRVEVAVKQTAMCKSAQVDIPVLFQKFPEINFPLHFQNLQRETFHCIMKSLQR